MKAIWSIGLYELKNGNYRVRIQHNGGERSVEGNGRTPHEAYRSAELKLIVKPWLVSAGEGQTVRVYDGAGEIIGEHS